MAKWQLVDQTLGYTPRAVSIPYRMTKIPLDVCRIPNAECDVSDAVAAECFEQL